jgi:hypothetical protein
MSKKKIFIVNGGATSGKSTFELACRSYAMKEHNDFIDIESIVNPVKRLLFNNDIWDGTKDDRGRKLLSDIKDLLTEYNNYPMRRTLRDVENNFLLYEGPAAFIDMREAADIDKFKELYGDVYDIQTLIIRRPGDEDAAKTSSNHADRDVFNYDYDIVVWNQGSLDDLNAKAEYFVDKYIYKSEDV